MSRSGKIDWSKTAARARALIRAGRPIGIGFFIYVLLNTAITIIPVFASSSATHGEYFFRDVPSRYQPALREGRLPDPLPTDRFPGCRWMMPGEPGNAWARPSDVPDPFAWIRCDEKIAGVALRDEPGGEYPMHLLAQRFESDPEWNLAQHLLRIFPVPPGPRTLIWVSLVTLAVGVALARPLDWVQDLKRGLRIAILRPWVLAILPLAGACSIGVFSVALPIRVEAANPAVEQLQALLPSTWFIVVLLPFLEEVVFRQWIYARVIQRLSTWSAAIGTSWVFMLAHVFNPQVGAMPAFLPTLFILGLILFWLRHRYGTLTLPALAHMSYNGLMVGISTWHGGAAS